MPYSAAAPIAPTSLSGSISAPDTSHTSPKKKRQEIEGLRTLAALLVAVYHIWFNKVSGGVDVFFVVTGFLITLTLVGHVRREGRIRPFAYLGRIARRVWPMGAVVLLAVLAMTVTIAPEALRARNYAEVFASALYFENWFLAANAIDYLNQHDPHTPAQHFWAMSLQGQFYVTWLVLALIALLLVVRGRTERRFKMAFGVLIAAVGGASFTWNLIQTAENQPFAYFSSLTRFWEFSVGGLLALAGGALALRGWTAAVASWVSVLGLVACGMVLPVEGVFPGVAALWPVACATLLLLSTRENEVPWAATRLLSNRAIAWLGGVAFGIYLWHFPILIGYRYLYGEDAVPSLPVGLAMIAAAIALAVVGHYLFERPVARGWNGAWTKVLITVALLGSLIAVAVLAHRGTVAAEAAAEQLEEEAAAAQATLGDCYGYAAMVTGDACDTVLAATPIVPDRSALKADTEEAYRCYTKARATYIESCTFGDGPIRIALIGNSHAALFSPVLRDAAKDHGWEITPLTSNGCVWGRLRAGDPELSEHCVNRVQQSEDLLFAGEPYDAVIFAGGRGGLSGLDNPQRTMENWRALQARGTRLVVVEDNPRIGDQGEQCVIEASEQELRDGACDTSREAATSDPDGFAIIAGLMGVPVVQTLDFYCDDTTCPAVIGSVIPYRDSHHLSMTYIRTFEDVLLSRLAEYIPTERPAPIESAVPIDGAVPTESPVPHATSTPAE
ncbi:acyltransferase family protein [Myceligenerans pegani]|uniref:Acyltransferase n=1 Tax=Myceligenerans pegani TaxID=2776917 RepID=A0ABR9MZC7_9MICO|nr:acyltransferase family protein [Myceligenerans sp. TRM 65318]MBE1876371.1 acyltransferase [Myceligenerans sp. TRM 65318]MBE3018642.1 acyltransferase [Myceligenerans sp. TRM 65318]